MPLARTTAQKMICQATSSEFKLSLDKKEEKSVKEGIDEKQIGI